MKIALIADSTAYLTQDQVERFKVNVIDLNVLFGNEVTRESEMNVTSFYERMRDEKELPTTSQPAIGDYVQLLESLKQDGYTDAIAIHLSSGISGTYQNAITAGSMVEGINMHAIDSEIACMPAGFYTAKAAELIEAEVPVTEIVAAIETMKSETAAYFLVDDLKNLHKGGRLTGAQAFIGSMLQVKPILHFVDTKIVPFDKVRTKKKAMKQIEGLIADFVGDETFTGTIIHSNCEAEAKAWLNTLQEKYPNVRFVLSHFGPVIGTHLGENALGFGVTKSKINI